MKEQKMEENLQLKYNKDRVTEQLEKRHKERQFNYENLQELRNKEASESEAIEYFENIFDTKIREIENDLNSLKSNTNQLANIFIKLTNNIQELQKYLSNSTIFLTDYKIKTCQNNINELTLKIDEMKNKLIPKKKFGFSNKKGVVPSSIKLLPDNKIKENELKNENLQKLKQQQFEWTISNEYNKIIILDENALNNQDITISNLNKCIIQLHGHPGSVQISNLKDCILVCGPIARSMFADNCTNSKFAFACQQMRLHSSRNCEIYLHVTCRAIIEDCFDIQVAPYNYGYINLDKDFIKSGLDCDKNNWFDIGDFNWLSPDKPSPNWKKMSEMNLIEDWSKFLEIAKNDMI